VLLLASRNGAWQGALQVGNPRVIGLLGIFHHAMFDYQRVVEGHFIGGPNE